MNKIEILFEGQKELARCRVQIIAANEAKKAGVINNEAWTRDISYIQGKETAVNNLMLRLLPEIIFDELNNETTIMQIAAMTGYSEVGIMSITLEGFHEYCKQVAAAKVSYYVVGSAL